MTKARNLGRRQATEDIVVFSDDDILVYDDTLINVRNIMRDSSVSMIAGIDDNASASRTDIGYLLGTKSFKNRKIGHVTKSMLGRYPDNIRGQVATQWAMGYFFVVRKNLLDKWDLKWDERLTSYAYAEDLDFSYSYYKKSVEEGLKCVLDERVRVKHMVSKEFRIPGKKSTYMYVCNRYYLSCKHRMGPSSKIAMRWANFWRLTERIIRKEKPEDMRNAIRYCKKHKKEIESGKFDY